jgi:hypothetical protein
MTEAEWLACTDPRLMLEHLDGRTSDRKVRLYACAWAWQVWRLLADERSREAVLTAERYADGLVSRSELILAFNGAQEAWKGLRVDLGGRHGKRVKSPKGTGSAKVAAAIARDAACPTLTVRSIRLTAWRANAVRGFTLSNILRELFGNSFHHPALDPAWLISNDGAVRNLAQAVYEEGRFEEMPVLADALEEAGCDNAEVLGHLRGEGPHVRGCWAVDLLLGKT